jgi:hypothetical protein
MNIYLEGGTSGRGGSQQTKEECLRGFQDFFRRAGVTKMPRIVVCGDRNTAFDRFATALQEGKPALLLVDSEAPVATDPKTGKSISPWQHFKSREDDKHWQAPATATDQHAQLMVQCMEAWFLADKTALRAYYGQGFNEAAIRDRPNVEAIPKADVYKQLADATKATAHGKYTDRAKGPHSFKILASLDPKKVAAASWHARRLLRQLGIKQDWTTL